MRSSCDLYIQTYRDLAKYSILLNQFKQLLQLRVLRLGYLQYRHARVSLSPQGQEIRICCFGFNSVALQAISAGQPQLGERTDRIQDRHPMVDNFLKLAHGLTAFVRRQKRLAPQIDRIQASGYSQFVRSGRLKRLNGLRIVAAAERQLRLQTRQHLELDDRVLGISLP